MGELSSTFRKLDTPRVEGTQECKKTWEQNTSWSVDLPACKETSRVDSCWPDIMMRHHVWTTADQTSWWDITCGQLLTRHQDETSRVDNCWPDIMMKHHVWTAADQTSWWDITCGQLLTRHHDETSRVDNCYSADHQVPWLQTVVEQTEGMQKDGFCFTCPIPDGIPYHCVWASPAEGHCQTWRRTASRGTIQQ